jgi:hypothetical protein
VENLADPSRDDLIILTAADVQAAYRELDHSALSGGIGGDQGFVPGASSDPRNPIAVPDQN